VDAVAGLFAGTVVDARVLGGEPGAASALKMAYAAWTKGTAAMLLAIRELARVEQVEQPLLEEWRISQPELIERSDSAVRSAERKGWRWVGEMELEVKDGDIAAFEVDAIANAANDHLWMGSGVAGALKRAGGGEIEREAVAKGPIPLGTAVATGAGRLQAKHVLHGAVMGQDLRTNADLVRRTTRSCLELADELGARSLALPAFGTGVGGFPLDECARIMVGETRAYEPRELERVLFAVFGDDARQAFEDAL
jgi:O-acetyl-ADP-ribose deacetylase (regulator of RNase III)